MEKTFYFPKIENSNGFQFYIKKDLKNHIYSFYKIVNYCNKYNKIFILIIW
jgi:hypothetical protein